MLKPYPFLYLFIVFLLFSAKASAQSFSNKANPNWQDAADWTGGAPGYTTTIAAELVHNGVLYQTLIIQNGSSITVSDDKILLASQPIVIENGGTLIIDGTLTTSGAITVESGGTLTVNGLIAGIDSDETITLNSGAIINIPNAGGMEWLGHIIWSTNSSSINGSSEFGGDFTLNAIITGSGNIDVSGNMDLQSGSIFGCNSSGNGCCGVGRTLFSSTCLMPSGSNETITSVQNGEWDDDDTWVGGEAPKDQDDVVIANGHIVEISSGKGPKIHNVTIDDGGTLYQNNNTLEVKGNYENNGIHNIEKKEAKMKSDGTSVDGTGEVNLIGNKAKFKFDDDITVLASADLLFFGDPSSDGVEVKKDKTVTNNGSIQMAAEVKGKDGIWVQGDGSDLYLFEDKFEPELNAKTSFNIVHYSDVASQDIFEPLDGEYNNLIIGGGGTKTLTSNLTITGFLVINGIMDVSVDDYQITIGGDWINKGEFIEREGKVIFNDESEMEIISELEDASFFDLEMNFGVNGYGKLFANLDVQNELTMTQGYLIGDNFEEVTIGVDEFLFGNIDYTAGHISAPIKRWAPVANGVTSIFPVGKNDLAYPITFTADVAVGGTATIEFVDADPNNNGSPWDEGAPGADFYNTFKDGYYQLGTGDGLTLGSLFDVDINITNFSSFPIGGTETTVSRDATGDNWVLNGTVGSIVGNSLTRTGLQELQIALVDDANCTTPVAPTFIASDLDVCIGEEDVVYTVTDVGLTYTWTIVGGTIDDLSDETSNSIMVNWEENGIIGTVSVYATDAACGAGPATSLDVNITPFTTSSITGQTIVEQNSTGEAYSIVDNGYSYDWTVSGGTIAVDADPNDETIAVDWGSAGNGSISVTADDVTNSCPTASPELLDVTLFSTFTSDPDGTNDYSLGTTWVGGNAPGVGANVKISAGHSVDLAANTTINNLVVDNTATLNTLTHELTITNLLEIDGTIDASTDIGGNNNIEFTASSNNAVLLGNGTIDVNRLEISSGTWTLDVSSNITANLDISSINASVLNIEGQLTLSGPNQVDFSSGNLYASTVGSTVSYTGSGAPEIMVPDDGYHNLILDGLGTYTLTADILVDGDFSLENGSFDPDIYSVKFSGDALQTITGIITFYDAEFKNVSGESPTFSAVDDIDFSNSAVLTEGVIDMNGNSFTVTGVDGLSGGNTTSFVQNGFVQSNISGTADAIIPVGAGSYYAPVGVNLEDTQSGNVVAEYRREAYSDLTVTDGLFEVSDVEHWNIIANTLISSSFPADYVRLYTNGVSTSSIVVIDDVRVSRYNGSDWSDIDFNDAGVPSNSSDVNGTYVEITNVESSDAPFTFGGINDPALPVEYTKFDLNAQNQTVQLVWETSTEINNDYFEVEHSVDGLNFSSIGRRRGSGNSNALVSYDFVHQLPSSGVNYYRLMQVDYDGNYEYSEVLSVDLTSQNNDLVIYPNPSNGMTKIETKPNPGATSKIVVQNINGTKVFQTVLGIGMTKVELDVSSYQVGVYFVQVVQGNNVSIQKLIISN